MLKYNFARVFRARGIERPFSFLKKAGFSDNFSTKIKKNQVKRLELKEVEKLCVLLKCTPNDVLEWVPDTHAEVEETHPLSHMKKPENDVDFVKTLNEIPLGKLEELERILKEHLGKK